MKAVLLDPSAVGAFYNGDSYLVLDNRGELGTDLHMWIGEIGTTCRSYFPHDSHRHDAEPLHHCVRRERLDGEG